MPGPGRGAVRFSPTVVLIFVVLSIAGGALLSSRLDGPAPGVLRLGILARESPTRIERAAGPLASWLGAAAGRAGVVVAPGVAGLDELEARADVVLVPASAVTKESSSRILVWVRPLGRPVGGVQLEIVSAARPRPGVAAVAGIAGPGLREELVDAGVEFDGEVEEVGSPFSERELLRAFVCGLWGAVVVRAGSVEDAELAGWLGDRAHTRVALGDPRPWMALVATSHLGASTRQSVGGAALELDTYRLDPSHAPAAAVLNALAELGIGGFSAPTQLSSLRP